MRKRLIEEDLTQLKDKLIIMGGATEKAIMLSIRSLSERDTNLAERVIREDDVIDQLELEMDAMCVDILVLKQPAASDLRFVIAVARAAQIIERIADHAVNLSKHALVLNHEPAINMNVELGQIERIIEQMFVEGLESFTRGDPEKAQATIVMDDEVDALYDQLYEQTIAVMEQDPASVARGAQWLSALKHLERIADYITNLCEQIIYMARGQVIKHSVW